MIVDFIKKSKFYLIALTVFVLIFWIFSKSFMNVILEVDGAIVIFVRNYIVSNSLTSFFKVVTLAGSVGFLIGILVFMFLFLKNKKMFLGTGLGLLFTYILSVIVKNIFRRERPIVNLIAKPKDYSFPSGHTMCSIMAYGFVIYLVLKYVKDKRIKYSVVLLLSLLLFLIPFSRIYLNVHFFSDVLCGAILGFICLRMFINYVKINNIV